MSALASSAGDVERQFLDQFSAALRASRRGTVESEPQQAPRVWPKLSKPISDLKTHYTNVVIGSGYGSSIPASRLARAGQEVCILERGQEKWPGEYPNTLAKVVPEVQIRTPLPPGRVGKEDGFLDFFIDTGTLVWQGCGLGGGSLVNSGIAIKPDMRLFDDPAVIPAGLRADKETLLKEGYDRAEAMLQPAQYPDQATNPLGKVEASEALAAAVAATGDYGYVKHELAHVNISYREHVNPVGLHQPKCELCGDCNTGCNFGAKNTLLMNYIYDAAQHEQTSIFCQVIIDYIEPVTETDMAEVRGDWTDVAGGSGGWRLVGRYIGDRNIGDLSLTIYADNLVVGAGTLGTTELLLRSRARGMPMSGQVGLKFGVGGDGFSFMYNGKKEVKGVGFGDKSPETVRRIQGDCGPCISSVIDMRDPALPYREGFIFEDIGIPGCFSSLINDLFPIGAAAWGKRSAHDPVDAAEAAAREAMTLVRGPHHPGATRNTLMVGVMAFDPQDGKMALEHDRLRIHVKFDKHSDDAVNACIEKCADAPEFKASYMNDPLLSIAGNRPNVHPFGGCTMGDDASSGAVNHKGQLFRSNTGTEVWENLYVWDGSTIPSSLGVNPLWTISAIAERGVALMAADRGFEINYGARFETPRSTSAAAFGTTTVLNW